MDLHHRIISSIISPVSIALIVIASITLGAYALPGNLLDVFGVESIDRSLLISYSPEVWFALIALAFGTLL